jgi:hypothetical protein
VSRGARLVCCGVDLNSLRGVLGSIQESFPSTPHFTPEPSRTGR